MSTFVPRTYPVALTGVLLLLLRPAATASFEPTEEMRALIEAGQRVPAVARLESDASGPRGARNTRLQLAILSPRRSVVFLQDPALRGDRDTLHLALARHALAAGDAQAALRYAGRLADSATAPEVHSQAQYLLAQAELTAGRTAQAERRMDWLSRHGDTPWREWGLYGRGHMALRRHDTVEALRLFRATTAQSDHEAIAPAFLLLGQIHDDRGEATQAIRYLTMYREAYPQGLTPVLEHGLGASSQADRAAGLVYTIQVGVFGERANALRQRDRFAALGYEVQLRPKTVAGRSYTAVWVGRFAAREAAARVRRDLEAQFQATYRVVVRE
jgi:tetratricopeptide (TPR) repeat protein